MKMIKRTLAAVISGAILATTLTSCNLFKKLTMAEMVSSMSDIKTGSYKMNADINSEDVKINFSADGNQSGENMSLDNFSLKYEPNDGEESSSPVDVTGKDLMKYIDGNVYLKINSILDIIKNASNGGFALDTTFLGINWVSIPMNFDIKNVESQSKELNKTMTNAIEDILKSSETEIAEDGDNGYKVTVTDNKQFAKIAGELAKNLKDNKDTYMSDYKKTFEAVEPKAITEQITNTAVDTVKALCDKLEIKYTDEDITKIKNKLSESMKSIDSEDLTITDEQWEEIGKSYDEMVSEIEDAKKEISESKDEVKIEYSVSLEGKEGSRVGKQSISIDGKNDNGEIISCKLNFEVTENDKTVEVPKDAKTISDCVGNIVDFLVKNGIIPQDQLEMFKGLNLSDMLNEFESGYNGYDDYDEDLDYDDIGTNEFDISDDVA